VYYKLKFGLSYRAVDQFGATIDFSLSKRRKRKNAQLFFIKAIEQNGKPELINIDKSGLNRSGIRLINKRVKKSEGIEIRRTKYMKNLVEQDHRFLKKRIGNGLGFKEFIDLVFLV
jgi:putative transposase